MVNQVIKERMDLRSHPKSHYPKSEAITIGDLHGNALKLAHFLLRHKVISFKDSVADPERAFQEFAAFYDESKKRATACLKNIELMKFNQKNIDKQEKELEKNTAAFEDLLTTILPEGLQSNEELQKLLDSSSEDENETFQILPDENEDFKRIIRTHIIEKNQRLGEGLAEQLPELQSTFPEIVEQFQELITKREKLIQFHSSFVNANEKLEKTLLIELKTLSEIVPIFNQFMEKLQVSDTTTLVRLIGDEMADRGSNDYFTLRFLDFLRENGVRVHTNISNHSNEFITAYENADFTSPGVVIGTQQPSFLALKLLVDKGLVSKYEVDTLIERSYKLTLKVIDYALNDAGITLFTHAPVDFSLIKLTADKLGVAYNDSTKEALAATIDEINRAFAKVVAENKVHELCDANGISSTKDMTRKEMIERPLLCLIWNRWNENKDTEEARPAMVNGYSCTYVHGHDDYASRFEHVINLDTSCGKEDLQTETRKVADAEAVVRSEPDSPIGLDAKKYLASIEERVLISGYAPTAVQNFKQVLESLRGSDATAHDDSQLLGP